MIEKCGENIWKVLWQERKFLNNCLLLKKLYYKIKKSSSKFSIRRSVLNEKATIGKDFNDLFEKMNSRG